MYLHEKQNDILNELHNALEKVIPVMEEWKMQLIQAQKYNDAEQCKDFLNKLIFLSNAITNETK